MIFCGKCCDWGIIGGVYIQAIKIPDRAHKTLRRAAGHERRQNGGGQEPGQDGRQISGRRRRQIGPGWHGVSRNRGRQVAAVVAAAYAGAGGGAHSCRPRAAQAASRQRGSRSSNQEPPAGRPDSSHRTRQGQPQHHCGGNAALGVATAPGRGSPPPAGAEQAAKASTNASGQAEDHTKRARALTRPREIGTPAPAKGTAGPQAKPCGFGSAKFF